MNNKLNYRIIEKDKFYIQRKTKFGWCYLYDIDNDIFLISAALAVILVLIFIVSIIIHDTQFVILYFSLGSAIISLISLSHLKINFETIIDAEQFIKIKIIKNKEKIETQNKRKNVKIHYLDIKIERFYKLKSIK